MLYDFCIGYLVIFKKFLWNVNCFFINIITNDVICEISEGTQYLSISCTVVDLALAKKKYIKHAGTLTTKTDIGGS